MRPLILVSLLLCCTVAIVAHARQRTCPNEVRSDVISLLARSNENGLTDKSANETLSQLHVDLKFIHFSSYGAGAGPADAIDTDDESDEAEDSANSLTGIDIFDFICLTGLMPKSKRCFQLLSINRIEEWKSLRCCKTIRSECPQSVHCLFNLVCPNTIRSCNQIRAAKR